MDIPLRILIVEDNPSDANLMVRRLSKDGFQVEWIRVEDEENYLAALEKGYDLILSDWSLPDFNGLRALKIARERFLDIPFVIISGSIGEEAAVNALHLGAADYLLKDRPERLGQAVRNAPEQKRMRDERKQAEKLLRLQSAALNAAANAIMITDVNGVIEWVNPAFAGLTGFTVEEALGKNPRELVKSNRHALEFYKDLWDTILAGKVWHGEMTNRRKDGQIYYEEQTITPVADPSGAEGKFVAIKQDVTERKRADKLLRETSEDLKIAYDATLQGWSNALELREHETAGHSRRVVQMTLNIARALGVNEAELVHIQRGALLHDIGKMGIPDSILLKPGPLTEEEWVVMRQHPVYAYELLSQIPYLVPALDIPHFHHERWDGSGYPQGLAGEGIPLAARIFTVVDVWDALMHDRPYRKAWSAQETTDYIRQESGVHIDPQIVAVFLGQISSAR